MHLLKITKPFFAIYILINILIFAFAKKINAYDISEAVLYFSNAFFLTFCLISTAIQHQAMKNKNPNVFIRSIMLGMILKMMSTAMALLIYFFYSGKAFNKRGVFISLFFYLIYLAIEVFSMMKLNKTKNA